MKNFSLKTFVKLYCPWANRYALKNIEGYLDELKKWNLRYNLTGIPQDLWIEKIVVESALLAGVARTEVGNADGHDRWMDMGTGAGIPGMILACLLPEQIIYLVDSRQKRTDFLTNVKTRLHLEQAFVVNQRLENLVLQCPELEQKISVFFSRALADIQTLIAYADPFAANGAVLISPRGESETKTRYNIEQNESRLWTGFVHTISLPVSTRCMHYAVLTLKDVQNV